MPEGTHGPLSTNARDEALRRLEAAEQRLLGAREAVRWQGEFIAQWKEEGRDTTAAEQLLPSLQRRLGTAERECRTLQEQLGIPLGVTKPRFATPAATVRSLGIRVET